MEDATIAHATRLTARMTSLMLCLLMAMISVDAFATGCPARKSKITTFEGKVDINQATERDLREIPRVGVKTARAIVDYRRANGEFKSMRQLYRVRGVGDKTMACLEKYAQVGAALPARKPAGSDQKTTKP